MTPTETLSALRRAGVSVGLTHDGRLRADGANAQHWRTIQRHRNGIVEALGGIALPTPEPFDFASEREPATFVWVYWHGGAQGDELRWSMRSVQTHFRGDASYLVVGDRPPWYSGPHLPVARVGHGCRDSLNKLRAACLSADVPERIVWMMDDVYILKPVTLANLSRSYFQGTVPATTPGTNNDHQRVKRDTFAALRARGLTPLDYATHLPHVVEKAKFLDLWQTYKLDRQVLLWEILYEAEHGSGPRKAGHAFRRVTGAVPDLSRACIVNNSVEGWTSGLRAELARRLPTPTAFERDNPRLPILLGIPVHDRPEALRECLASLSRMGCDARVVLHLDAPDAECRRIAEESGHECIVSEQQVGLPAGLNRILRLRKPGQHFARMDSDFVMETDGWLARLERSLAGYGAVGPYRDYPPEAAKIRPMVKLGAGVVQADRWRGSTGFHLIAGHVLDKLSGFTVYGHYGAEDSDYYQRMHAAGYVTAYDCSVVAREIGAKHRRETASVNAAYNANVARYRKGLDLKRAL